MLVFLFTDIQGSTQLWEVHGRAMGEALLQHDTIVQACIETHGGTIIKHTGDGVFAVFDGGTPLDCAVQLQQRLLEVRWGSVGKLLVRVVLHRGEAEEREGDYFGSAVNKAARLLKAAWGGQILLSDEIFQHHDPPANSTLVDYGVHMLKDLGHPQRIYGLIPAGQEDVKFPPLRSLSTRSHNLPPQSTPFVGRREELADLMERLDSPGCRLLTLVGPGGVGKTRLSLQLGAEKVELFAHGVYQVPLASLSSVEFIYTSIGDALRLPFSSTGSPREQLLNYLREKDLLLILDNFEHLIGGAAIVADLLQNAPRLKIVITSQERLNLQEEWLYEVRGLPVPDESDNVEEFSAFQLFLQNAYRVYPDLQLNEESRRQIVQICKLVEGIPLGIELASAWVRMLSPAEIVQEIEASRDFLATTSPNVPRRHRSLRAVFENSWNLLSERERETLRKLTVFRGSFDREAARQVVDASLPLLLTLNDKSLIRRTAAGRYEMLGMLRQYAGEKLDQYPAGKEETLKRHSHYFTGLLERYRRDLRGGQQKEAIATLEVESENIREAWHYAVTRRDLAAIQQGHRGLFHFYEIRCWLQEGLDLFQQASAALPWGNRSTEEEKLFGTLMVDQGWFAYRLGLYEQARRGLQESLNLFRRLDEQGEQAVALHNLGILSYQLGDYEQAEEYLEEGLKIRRQLDDQLDIARTLSILGIIARDQGRYEEAQTLLQESLVLHRTVMERRGISRCLNILALIRGDLGDKVAARAMLEESVEISREIGDPMGIAFALSILGSVVYDQGDYLVARELCRESLEIREEIGDLRGMAFSLNDLGNIACALEKYDTARTHYLRALRKAQKIHALPLALYVLSGIAQADAHEGYLEQAYSRALLITRHPSAFEVAIEKAQKLVDEIGPRLSPEVRDYAKTTVTPDSFEAMIAQLLQNVVYLQEPV